jgi:hypothetical protein
MIALDSPEWVALEHAYGAAGADTAAPSSWSAASGFQNYSEIPSIPSCLKRLEDYPGPTPEWQPWDTLVSCLCHQGTIYSASFAAVPHVIAIGLRAAATQDIDYGFFLLPTLIEQARLEGQHPVTPAGIFEEYLAVMPLMHDLAHAARRLAWDQSYTAVVGSALAAVKGHLQLSKMMLECADEKIFEDFQRYLSGE